MDIDDLRVRHAFCTESVVVDSRRIAYENQRVRRTHPNNSAEVTAAYAGWSIAPCPSTRIGFPPRRGRFEHQLLGRTGREIRNNAIDGDSPTGDHDAGLTGRDELGRRAGSARGANDFQRSRHLADIAVVADRQYDRCGYVVGSAAKQWHVGWLAHVPNRRAGIACGFPELCIVAEHVVQPADDLESRVDCGKYRGAPVGW